MFATTALIALFASATPDVSPRLGLAKPSEAASAVASCMKAIRPGGVDESRLIADGWQRRSGSLANGRFFTHQENASVLLTMDGPLSDLCLVRVKLSSAVSIKGAGDRIDRLLGVKGKRKSGHPGNFFWRSGNRTVASEGFDDGPGSPPYMIQIAIGELPKEIR